METHDEAPAWMLDQAYEEARAYCTGENLDDAVHEHIKKSICKALVMQHRALLIAEASRDFWYRCYTGASCKAHKSVQNIITDCIVHDFENDEGCEKILRRVQARVDTTIDTYFVMPTKTGETSPPLTSIPGSSTRSGPGGSRKS